MAYVVIDTGADTPPTADDLITEVNKTLGRWTGLRDIHFVEALPTTKSGKITRKALATAQSL